MSPQPISSPSIRLRAPISVCIVTNQWHPKLNDIIDVLRDIVDEILIGYDGDISCLIPQQNQDDVKILEINWQGYSTTKNKLAAKARNHWILSLDSDEVPDESLLTNIAAIQYDSLSNHQLFKIKRLSFFEGQLIKHGSWGNDYVIRLYNKNYSKWDNALVHESLERNNESILSIIPGTLLHYTADNYQNFMEKSMRYAKLSADKYFLQKKHPNFIKSYISPLFSFLKEYIFQLGFLDGGKGWKIAAINAKYTYWKYAFLKEKYNTTGEASH